MRRPIDAKPTWPKVDKEDSAIWGFLAAYGKPLGILVLLALAWYWAATDTTSFMNYMPNIIYICFSVVVFTGLLSFFLKRYEEGFGKEISYTLADNLVIAKAFVIIFLFTSMLPTIFFLISFTFLSAVMMLLVYGLDLGRSLPIILFLAVAGGLLNYASPDIILFCTRILGAIIGLSVTPG